MSAKKLALKAVRAVNKMDKEEETKWVDSTFTVNLSGAPALCEPFTSTTSGNSVLPLTLVEPMQSNSSPATQQRTINSSNYREGAKIYLSGLYLKAQFYWPQIRDSTSERYPPYANISWAIVREVKNNASVAPYSPTVYPTPLDVWQVPSEFVPSAPPLWNQQEAPLSSLLFRNMNNGHNYKILRKGNFCLAAPVMTQQGPAQVTPGNGIMSSYGTNATQLTQTLPHQFSNNSVKTLNIKLHPKLRVRYRQLPELSADQTAVTQEQIVPLENGIYFMFWCDVGRNNADSRFYSQAPATYSIVQPQLILNERLRFKDT